MVIITMNGSAVLETGNRLPINDDPVVKLVRLDPKLGYTSISGRFHAHDRMTHPIDLSSP